MISSVRLNVGATSQEKVAAYLRAEGFKINSIAKKGSILPDIVASKNSKKIQIEVKGASGFNASGTFDLTVSRGRVSSDKNIKKLNYLVKLIAEYNRYKLDDSNQNYIEQYIDLIRKKNKSVGFVGDSNVPGTTGSIPVKYFQSDDTKTIKYALDFLKDHLKESNDDYFCLVDPVKNQFILFGKPDVNLFEINTRYMMTSDIRRVFLKTYGATERGKLRISLVLSYNKNMFSQRIRSL